MLDLPAGANDRLRIVGCEPLADLRVFYWNMERYLATDTLRALQQPTWKSTVETVTGCPDVKVTVDFQPSFPPLTLNDIPRGSVLVRRGPVTENASGDTFAGVRSLYVSDGVSPDLCVFLKGEIVFFDHLDTRIMRERQIDVLRHEIGHVLGLFHSSNPESLMFSDVGRGERWLESDLAISRAAYARGPCAARGQGFFETVPTPVNRDGKPPRGGHAATLPAGRTPPGRRPVRRRWR